MPGRIHAWPSLPRVLERAHVSEWALKHEPRFRNCEVFTDGIKGLEGVRLPAPPGLFALLRGKDKEESKMMKNQLGGQAEARKRQNVPSLQEVTVTGS